MSSWILSIVGIACLGVLFEIIIPDGQTNKYVKGVFSLLVVTVVIMPIPKIVSSGFNFEISSGQFEVDEVFLQNENALQRRENEKKAVAILTSMGYETEVAISGTGHGKNFEVAFVEVKLKKMNIEVDDLNIHIQKIKSEMNKLFDVKEEKVQIEILNGGN